MNKASCRWKSREHDLSTYQWAYPEINDDSDLALFLNGCPDCPFWEGNVAPTSYKCKPKVEYGKTKGSKRVKATVSPRKK